MTRLLSSGHFIRTSILNQESATLNNAHSHDFRLAGEVGTPVRETNEESNVAETGRDSLLPTGSTILSYRFDRTLPLRASNDTVGFYMYSVGNSGVLATKYGTDLRNQWWNGANTGYLTKSHTHAELSGSGVTDADIDKVYGNCVTTAATLSGERGGLVQLNATILGGGAIAEYSTATTFDTNAGTAPTAANFGRDRIYNNSCDLKLTMADGVESYVAADPSTHATTNWSDASPSSMLTPGGTGLQVMTPYCHSWSIERSLEIDFDQSLSMGTTATKTVEGNADWYITGVGLTFKLTFYRDSALAYINTIIDRYEAGSTQGIELGLIGDQVNAVDYAHYMIAAANCKAIPGSFSESNDTNGNRLFSIDYMPYGFTHNSIKGHGWMESAHMGSTVNAGA